MSEFTSILEYTLADNKHKKSLMGSYSFRNSVPKAKRLLISEADDYSTLLQESTNDVIIDGAKERQCMRNILPVIYDTEGYKSKIIYGSVPTEYAEYVAEGAEIPIDVDTYSSTSITVKKAASRPMITKEMIEDGKYGMIELELKKAGARLENKLNQECIGTLLDGANGTTPADVDPGGTHIALDDISIAYGDMSDVGWRPSKLVLHPQAAGYMQSDTNCDVIYDNGNLWNLNTYILDAVVDATKTNHWLDTDAATNYTGLLLDSTNYAIIDMKSDISIKEFNDPINDLVGITASMRFGCGVLNDNACVRILAK